MQKLILHSIDSSFDPKNDLVAGAWCFAGKEDYYPDWEHLNFLNPFPTAEIGKLNAEKTAGLAYAAVEIWGERLNKLHNLNYETKFWHPILFTWALLIIQFSWRRYIKIKHIADLYSDKPISTSVMSEAPVVSNTLELVLGLFDVGLIHYWIVSEIVKLFAKNSWQIETNSNFKNLSATSPGHFDFQFENLPGFNIPGTNRYEHKFFQLLSNIAPRRKSNEASNFKKADLDFFPEEFLELVTRLLSQLLPESLKVHFPTLNKHALKFKYRAGKLNIGFYDFYNDFTNIVVGHRKLNGERIVSCQHGAIYGISKIMPQVAGVEYSNHAFITWGWHEHEGYQGNFVPLPSPRFSKLSNKHKKSNDKIILGGACILASNGRIDVYPELISYRAGKRIFIDALNKQNKADLWYRPYPKTKYTTFKDKDYLKKHYPNLRYLEGSLEKEMVQCKLIILDHPGTPLHTALAANVPTICYWDPDQWPITSQAQPIFDKLIKAGILHIGPQQAADKVNEVSDDIQSWWNSKNIQQVRKDWCAQHAGSNRFWWYHWIKAIWTI